MSRRPGKSQLAAAFAAADRLPAWFDPARHLHTSDGIIERATGHFLAADGQPASAAIRAALAPAAAPEPAEPEPAAIDEES